MRRRVLKIWIDILTPKQVRFFKPLIEALQEKGCEVYVTARRYRELNRMFSLIGYKALLYGKHGGGSLYDKLHSSLKRSLSLAKDVASGGFDFSISFSSVEAARISYGLSIPHYCISDSPHAEAVSKLTVPLSQLLFTPKAVPKKAWMRFGIEPQRIIQYDSLDPAAWLKGFQPDRRVLEELNLNSDRPIITVRPEEAEASYLLYRRETESPISRFLKNALKWEEDFQVVVLPRYLDQINEFKTKFVQDDKVKVSTSPVDGASLIGLSNLFIGAGGTMTVEAALQGVPTISCFPSKPTYIERHLLRHGLIRRIIDLEEASRAALKLLKDPSKERLKVKAERLLMVMEDPIDVIHREILARHRAETS